MLTVLTKACSFILVIAIGYLLKRKGFFRKEDFSVIAKIVINITLPCAVISNFGSLESFSPSLLFIVLFGLVCNLILVGVGWLRERKKSGVDKAFAMLNGAGYNIGCFALPYVQSFLGPLGVVTTCLFDAGNALMCNGGTYSMASAVSTAEKTTVKDFIKKMVQSPAFDAYVIMLLMSFVNLRVPDAVMTFTGIVGSANSFMAMLMIGVGFEITLNRKHLKKIVGMLTVRFLMSTLFAAFFYFVTPFPLEIRQVLVLVAYAPVSSVAVAYTGKCGGDVSIASVINSLSIIISLITLTVLMLFMSA